MLGKMLKPACHPLFVFNLISNLGKYEIDSLKTYHLTVNCICG